MIDLPQTGVAYYLQTNYNKKAIIQATTIKNVAAIPKHPTGFLVGATGYIG